MDKPAARTAMGPMVVCAVDQFEEHPLIHDELAQRFLPGAARSLLGLARLSLTRRSIQKRAERYTPGIWSNMLCRKRFIDDRVLEAVAGGIGSVVILGAGLDTRAYRLPELAATRVFEVDQQRSIENKRARVAATLGSVPEQVSLVPTDFRTDDLAKTLANAGYRADEPTVFVWEGVTQYLTEDGIDATGRFLAEAASGSRLVFTYVQQDFLTGQNMFGAPAAYLDWVVKGKLWRFGLSPKGISDFLGRYGWTEREQAGSAEYTERYLRPAGRALPTTELERAVYAAKP